MLVEEKQIRPNGSVRSRGLPLSEKLHGSEEWEAAIPRAIEEELGSILEDSPKVTLLMYMSSTLYFIFPNPCHESQPMLAHAIGMCT